MAANPPRRRRGSSSSTSSSDGDEREAESPSNSPPQPTLQRQESSVGTMIRVGHPRHELIYIMILGIRTTVGKSVSMRLPDGAEEPTKNDCAVEEPYRFLSDGTEKTPAHPHSDFKFVDYAPLVFRALRNLFFHSSDYLVSLTKEYVLTELSSPGKSGSFFYFSQDLRFVLKTITKAEAKYFRSVLYQYYLHVRAYPNTLLTKFCGLHRVKPHKGKKTYFVVMQNVFPPFLDIHQRFDLKGSTQGRTVGEQKIHDEGAVLKDLDFLELEMKLLFGPEKRHKFIQQLNADSRFLDSIDAMDYSLLIGVHDKNLANATAIRARALSVVQPMRPQLQSRQAVKAQKEVMSRQEYKKAKKELTLRPVRLKRVSRGELIEAESGAHNIPVSLFHQDEGGYQSTNSQNTGMNLLYFIGIIDFLQPYNMTKKMEHLFKSARYNKDIISSVPPTAYAKRFREFIAAHTGSNPNDEFDEPTSPTGPRSGATSAIGALSDDSPHSPQSPTRVWPPPGAGGQSTDSGHPSASNLRRAPPPKARSPGKKPVAERSSPARESAAARPRESAAARPERRRRGSRSDSYSGSSSPFMSSSDSFEGASYSSDSPPPPPRARSTAHMNGGGGATPRGQAASTPRPSASSSHTPAPESAAPPYVQPSTPRRIIQSPMSMAAASPRSVALIEHIEPVAGDPTRSRRSLYNPSLEMLTAPPVPMYAQPAPYEDWEKARDQRRGADEIIDALAEWDDDSAMWSAPYSLSMETDGEDVYADAPMQPSRGGAIGVGSRHPRQAHVERPREFLVNQSDAYGVDEDD